MSQANFHMAMSRPSSESRYEVCCEETTGVTTINNYTNINDRHAASCNFILRLLFISWKLFPIVNELGCPRDSCKNNILDIEWTFFRSEPCSARYREHKCTSTACKASLHVVPLCVAPFCPSLAGSSLPMLLGQFSRFRRDC